MPGHGGAATSGQLPSAELGRSASLAVPQLGPNAEDLKWQMAMRNFDVVKRGAFSRACFGQPFFTQPGVVATTR